MSKNWERLHGGGTWVDWRDLRHRNHWAEISPDGSWMIFQGWRHRPGARKVAQGSASSPEKARTQVGDWEKSHR